MFALLSPSRAKGIIGTQTKRIETHSGRTNGKARRARPSGACPSRRNARPAPAPPSTTEKGRVDRDTIPELLTAHSLAHRTRRSTARAQRRRRRWGRVGRETGAVVVERERRGVGWCHGGRAGDGSGGGAGGDGGGGGYAVAAAGQRRERGVVRVRGHRHPSLHVPRHGHPRALPPPPGPRPRDGRHGGAALAAARRDPPPPPPPPPPPRRRRWRGRRPRRGSRGGQEARRPRVPRDAYLCQRCLSTDARTCYTNIHCASCPSTLPPGEDPMAIASAHSFCWFLVKSKLAWLYKHHLTIEGKA